jgi:hypothetical protein
MNLRPIKFKFNDLNTNYFNFPPDLQTQKAQRELPPQTTQKNLKTTQHTSSLVSFDKDQLLFTRTFS